MYDSEFIYIVEFCMHDGHLFFYANVAASQRAEIMWFPKVCLELKTGKIVTTICGCEAGDAGQCTHVSTLLCCLLDLFSKKKPPPPLKVRKACTEVVNISFVIIKSSVFTIHSFQLF